MAPNLPTDLRSLLNTPPKRKPIDPSAVKLRAPPNRPTPQYQAILKRPASPVTPASYRDLLKPRKKRVKRTPKPPRVRPRKPRVNQAQSTPTNTPRRKPRTPLHPLRSSRNSPPRFDLNDLIRRDSPVPFSNRELDNGDGDLDF